MEKVATRAGVGKATVYRRWGSKVELAVDAVRGSMADVDDFTTGSLQDDLVQYIGSIVAWLKDSDTGRMMAGMTAEIQRNAALAEALRTTLVAPRRQAMGARLEKAIADGELRDDVDVNILLDLLVGPAFYRLLISGLPMEASMAESSVRIMLQGASKRTPAEL
jgi:AcrR family transcriptional regulator